MTIGSLLTTLIMLAAPPAPWEKYRGTVAVSPTTGEMLNRMCNKNPVDGRTYNPCTSYILGIVDGLAISNRVCLPSGATTDQIVQVAVKHLRNTPERWHLHATDLLEEALVSAFPCGRPAQ